MANRPADKFPNYAESLHGRHVIMTDAEEITMDNISSVLAMARGVHMRNRGEIDYLWKYYKGVQPILTREKQVRPEINHKVVENRANQIVNFKVGYCFGEPIQYVSGKSDKSIGEAVAQLNEYSSAEDKATKDTELAYWMHICGTGYRMVLPDSSAWEGHDEAPFELSTLDPRDTMVIYQNRPGRKPLMGVTIVQLQDKRNLYCCYTDRLYVEIAEDVPGEYIKGTVVKSSSHALGTIPIIEYPLNPERMGCFEVVLPLLDAINETASDRQNGIDQFIQALLVFYNVDIDDKEYTSLRESGALKLKDSDPQFKSKVEYLINALDQNGAESLTDHQYQTVLEIVGMPNRNGGSSTSDTGVATIIRDGWSDAESRAKNTEGMFRASEKRTLKLILRICKDLSSVKLNLKDIDIQFTRRNYENISQKAAVLTMMLESDKIHPKLAFEHCGMFVDPERAYLESEAYMRTIAKEEVDEQTDNQSVNDRADPDDTLRA